MITESPDTAPAPRIHPDALTDFVERMEAAVGAGQWDDAAAFFTPDLIYRVGNREPSLGVEGLKAYMAWQTRFVQWEGHALKTKFSRGDIAVFEVDSHFTRLKDGAALVIPCTDIYTFSGGLIADWRVYADTSIFVV